MKQELGTACVDKAEVDGLLDSKTPETTGIQEAKKPKKREQWARKIDFLVACVGFSVGLGNVWRFPYLCYKNGGGAFLIPYFMCVVAVAVPMFFLEVALGQFMSTGGIGVWSICPLFQGIGYSMVTTMFLVNVYYNVIMAWAFHYLFSSFTSTLPWSHCDNSWNTPSCRDGSNKNGTDIDIQHYNSSHGAQELNNISMVGNLSMVSNETKIQHTDPTTEYWELKVLQISSGIDDMGTIRWDLALCLLLAWVLVFLCIIKGIKSSGKVMYFTATSPYILMFVLLVRGVTLPGAVDGLKFYVIPEWHKLKDLQVWVDAGTQVFFSYSLSNSTLIVLGSFNKWKHNSYKDSVIFACLNSGTSIFAGFVIFSVLGFMAHELGVDISEVAESGPGLAFIAYPKAVAEMPLAPLWSVLFFLMIILLGLDSQFVGVEGVMTTIVDQHASYLRRGWRRQIFLAVMCLLSFLVGLFMVTNGGAYVFQLFDYYSGNKMILLLTLSECVIIAWIYGVKRFYDNIEMMMGKRLSPFMKISWCGVTPIVTAVVFALSVYTYSEVTYNRVYTYPPWAIAFGWIMASATIVFVPLLMVIKLSMEDGSLKERLRTLTRPRLQEHQLRPQDDPKELVNGSIATVKAAEI